MTNPSPLSLYAPYPHTPRKIKWREKKKKNLLDLTWTNTVFILCPSSASFRWLRNADKYPPHIKDWQLAAQSASGPYWCYCEAHLFHLPSQNSHLTTPSSLSLSLLQILVLYGNGVICEDKKKKKDVIRRNCALVEVRPLVNMNSLRCCSLLNRKKSLQAGVNSFSILCSRGARGVAKVATDVTGIGQRKTEIAGE